MLQIVFELVDLVSYLCGSFVILFFDCFLQGCFQYAYCVFLQQFVFVRPFLRAEGALKGWNMGGDAKTFYEKGVRLSFEEFGVSGADDYLADATSIPGNYVDNLIAGHTGNNYTNQSSITIKWEDGADDAKKLERVLTQKWIACYPDPMNGWADFRRTGYPRIFPATESMNADCNTGRGQRRLRFTRSEYNNNKANVEAAVSMLSNGKDSNGTDLWWAMKENGTY